MKTTSLAFLVLAFTALVPAVTQARSNNNDAYRHAQSMRTLSEGMVREFREDISHHRPSRDEGRFLQTLRTLESQCESLLNDVRKGEDRDRLERNFKSIERNFHSTRDSAPRMGPRSGLKEMMAKFDRSLHAFEDARFSNDRRHDDRPAPAPPRKPSGPGGLIKGLLDKLDRR